MDRLNKIFNFVSLLLTSVGLGRNREWKLWERDGSRTDHCWTGMEMGMTAMGTGKKYQSRAKL